MKYDEGIAKRGVLYISVGHRASPHGFQYLMKDESSSMAILVFDRILDWVADGPETRQSGCHKSKV